MNGSLLPSAMRTPTTSRRRLLILVRESRTVGLSTIERDRREIIITMGRLNARSPQFGVAGEMFHGIATNAIYRHCRKDAFRNHYSTVGVDLYEVGAQGPRLPLPNLRQHRRGKRRATAANKGVTWLLGGRELRIPSFPLFSTVSLSIFTPPQEEAPPIPSLLLSVVRLLISTTWYNRTRRSSRQQPPCR